MHRARVRPLLVAGFVALTIGTAPPGAVAQTPPVDLLLARLFSSDTGDPYELTADFTGTLVVSIRGGRLVVAADGSFEESRDTDGVKRRKVTVRRLELPLLLRPFAANVKRVIEEKIETQSENPETFHAHDIFVYGDLPGHRYILVGVHRAIVDEAIDRYGKPQDKIDPATRRHIAQWLYTTLMMRDFLVRPGPPYALLAVVDESGLLYELVGYYDWGEVRSRVDYVILNGQPVWSAVAADTVSNLSSLGRVTGQLLLVFTNHCVNCKR